MKPINLAIVLPTVGNLIPSFIKDSVETACRSLSEKVDLLQRGVSAYAYKPSANATEDLRYLGSRAQFINPTFQQLLKAFIFFGVPVALSVRALSKVRLGNLIPAPTLMTAIIGLISLTEFAGLLRLKFRANDLETALRTIVAHAQPGLTLENLPRLTVVNGRVEMGTNSIGVVVKPNTNRIDYVAFRYVENLEEGNKIHTRVFVLGNPWIQTGTIQERNHVYDVSTSLEGRFIGNLLVAAKNAPLVVNIPPPQPTPLLEKGLKGLARTLIPDSFRQKCSLVAKDLLDSIHHSYWGKSEFTPPENKKNGDLHFLASRHKFVNLTPTQVLKNGLFFGPLSFFSIYHLATLKLGPYMPFTASLALYLGKFSLTQLAGAFMQYLSGNDLEKALIAIVKIGAPSVQAQAGRTVLDALPTIGNLSAIKNDAGKTTHVRFVYREGSREISRTYYIGKQWFRNTTFKPLGNTIQNASALESHHIEKLIEIAQAFNGVNAIRP